MQLYAVGINHQSAPVKVRERVAFNGETMPEALRNLVQTGPVCTRSRNASDIVSPLKATRSRTLTGALWWLMPTA